MGYHSFTGNDYVSLFFRRGKEKCWQILGKSRLQSTLSLLEENWTTSDDLLSTLEEYVCQLYGFRCKNIDTVLYKLFTKKYTQENNIIDMTALPSCRYVLKLDTMRANTVPAILNRSTSPIIELSQLSQCDRSSIYSQTTSRISS